MGSARARSSLLLVAGLVVIAGCTATSDDKIDPTPIPLPSVSAPPPVMMNIGAPEDLSFPYGSWVMDFVSEVDRRTGGALDGAPRWDAAPTPGQDAEEQIAGLLASGNLESAVVPVRAWDQLGVGSISPLMAPLEVDSEPLVAKIVTTDDLVNRLVAGLPAKGAYGLALVPDGLRHPIGYSHPLLAVSDFAGTTIRGVGTRAASVVEALGATPIDVRNWEDKVDAHQIDGIESSFLLWDTLPDPERSTVTANVTWFPNVDVLAVSKSWFDGLPSDQQEEIRSAALAARDRALTSLKSEREIAPTYCAAGGHVMLATPDQVASVKAATAPITRQIESDADAKAMLDEIRALRAALPAPTYPATC